MSDRPLTSSGSANRAVVVPQRIVLGTSVYQTCVDRTERDGRIGCRARPAADPVRHEAPCCIPGAAGKNSEGGSWVRWLTWIRKVKGTRACQESSGRAQAYGREALRDPRNMVKAELPKV